MKREVLTFTIPRQRNFVAKNMLDRDSPYHGRRESDKRQYRRREKHRNIFLDNNVID